MSHLITMIIEPNTFVTLDYTLHDDEGNLLDASEMEGGASLEYVQGYGMIVPGLEAAVAGLCIGDEKEIVLEAADAYGEYDEDGVQQMNRNLFPLNVSVGDSFVAESPDGDEIEMEVVGIEGDLVWADANHPLAGMKLHYQVKVRDVRDATDEEIEDAASLLDEAHEHVHGPDCDHDHEVALSRLGRGTSTLH